MHGEEGSACAVCVREVTLQAVHVPAFSFCDSNSTLHPSRVRDQHSREVSEMEEILQKEISDVRENQMAKVRN